MIVQWIIGGVLGYIFLIWVILPSVSPFMRKRPLPARIPQVYLDAVKQLERQSKTEYEYIKNASEYLISTNHGGRISTILRFHLAFETDLKKLFDRRGFMHCQHFNHLMRILLVKSKHFTDDQIRIRTTFINFFIHQYLQVHVAGQWYDVDLWGKSMGVPLGKHAGAFR